jgi:hypothetical protein
LPVADPQALKAPKGCCHVDAIEPFRELDRITQDRLSERRARPIRQWTRTVGATS